MEITAWIVCLVVNVAVAVINGARAIETLREGAFEFATLFGVVAFVAAFMAVVAVVGIAGAL